MKGILTQFIHVDVRSGTVNTGGVFYGCSGSVLCPPCGVPDWLSGLSGQRLNCNLYFK